ncbi:MAG: MoxR family ATPase [Elusimicrobia bacterium]|nr:MoxR family ATPase [Elusimicrobiota bacterium]
MKTKSLKRTETLLALILAGALNAPAAAQVVRSAVRTAPVGFSGASAAGAAPVSRAPTLSGSLPGLGAALPTPSVLPTAPALLAPQAVPAAAAVPTVLSAAQPAALTSPAAIPSAPVRAEAGSPAAAAKSFAAAAAPVRKALSSVPDAAKASASSAYGSGAALEAAITGRRAASVSGTLVPTGRRAPTRSLLGRPVGAVSAVAPAVEPSGAADQQLAAEVSEVSAMLQKLRDEVANVIVGQREMVDSIILAMIANEHILLEGVPGVAKTATVQAFATATGADYQKIQGTPDKMPADILGAEILQTDQATGRRETKLEKGPIFAQFVLADEINRMMPKTQAALLEAMQNREVSIGRETLPLPKPFLLLATMNPLEQEGVNVMPEAQLDRFMFKVVVPQPNRDERKLINELNRKRQKPKATKSVTLEDLERATAVSERVVLGPQMADYIQDILDAAQDPHSVGIGTKGLVEQAMVTRASIMMEKASRIQALMNGRSEVRPEDVMAVAPKILRHRIILSYAAGEMSTDALIAEILNVVPIRK